MHGWFLPALGLALLGGAGFTMVEARLPRPRLITPVLLLVMLVDVLLFNELQNPLAFARRSFDELYASPLRAFGAQVAATQPPVERLYGAPLAAVGYRNHELQSHVDATYGYNPLELLGYADYAEAAEANPRLVDGLAATHRLSVSPTGSVSIEVNPSALPFAFFARHVTVVADDAATRGLLVDLNPAEETIVVGQMPAVVDAAPSAREVGLEQQGGDGADATIHYRAAAGGLLRIAIPFYPGWHAAVAGRELPVLEVDDALLGVVVPAGEGDLRVWYAPRYFWPGAVVSTLAAVASVAALVIGFARWRAVRRTS
jgi:hypothetical protein